MGRREVEIIETITVHNYPEEFSATYEADKVWNLIENRFFDVGECKTRWILDGEFKRVTGIQVLDADGVVVENMTARNYVLNGFYWTGVEGFRGSYLTAHNMGDYGIYAFGQGGTSLDAWKAPTNTFPDPGTGGAGGLGGYSQPPPLGSTVDGLGNPDLQPVRSVHASVSTAAA